MKILLNNLVNELEEKINKIKEILKRLDLCIDEKVIFIYLIDFLRNKSRRRNDKIEGMRYKKPRK